MADLFEEEGEPTISIKDYLKEVEEQELEADLVLGGDEGKECTYGKGYMKRQAIFSCLTCTPDGNAGVCTACSLSCHDGHEIVELWTKRNFRCDCGNSKFGAFYCKLNASKDTENSDNSYNHNFKGLYCTCNRQYPDPSTEEQEEMIQCCICEDWFHEEHLGLESSDQIPKDEEGEPLYEDFICQSCSVVFSFLSFYAATIWAAAKQHDVANMTKHKAIIENPPPLGSLEKVGDGSSSGASTMTNNPESDASTMTNNPESDASTMTSNTEGILGERGVLLGKDDPKDGILNPCNQNAGPSGKCILGVNLFEAAANVEKSKPMFLSKNWREALCRCEQCAAYYAQKKIGFLLDKEDSIAEYEKVAKEKRNEKRQQEEDVEQHLLNNLDHVGKIEFLSGVADMKSEIHAFLESVDQSKPITSADIHQIFENLAKKRKRMP